MSSFSKSSRLGLDLIGSGMSFVGVGFVWGWVRPYVGNSDYESRGETSMWVQKQPEADRENKQTNAAVKKRMYANLKQSCGLLRGSVRSVRCNLASPEMSVAQHARRRQSREPETQHGTPDKILGDRKFPILSMMYSLWHWQTCTSLLGDILEGWHVILRAEIHTASAETEMTEAL